MSSFYKKPIASMIACAALAILAIEGASSSTPTFDVPPPAMTTDFVRITAPWIAIPIESKPLACEVGEQLTLIQENDDFFITMRSNEYDGVFLAAFPVNTRDGRPAWTTPERKVIFAYRTSSCRGKIYFRQGDQLPVAAETRGDYTLKFERFGHIFPLCLSKKSAGIEFTKIRFHAPTRLAATKPTRGKTRIPAQNATLASIPRSSPLLTAADSSTNLFTPSMAARDPSTHAPIEKKSIVASSVSAQKLEPPNAVTNETMAAAPSYGHAVAKQTPRNGTLGLSNFTKYQTSIIISVSLVLFIIGLYWETRRKTLRRDGATKKAVAERVVVGNSVKPPPPLRDSSNDFSGSISSMSLGSVTQFLNSDKETGTLFVKDKNNVEIGTLAFIQGEIIDAKSSNKRGIDALYEILRNKEGFFSFLREKQPKSTEKTITQGTISLLLDAHRIMDEEHMPPIPASPAVSKAAVKLRLHGNH